MSEYRVELPPHQLAAHLSRKRHVAMLCGVGAGKTHTLAGYAFRKMVEGKDVPADAPQGIICANTYSQLIDSTLRRVFEVWRDMGLKWTPNKVPKGKGPVDLEVQVGGRTVTVLCRSLDNYEALSGLEVGWAGVDEVYGASKEALAVLNARVRGKWQQNQTMYCSTLDEPDSFMHEFFVDKYDPDRMTVIYAPTSANLANLPRDYIDDMMALYDERLARRMIFAEWITLSTGQIYHQFSRTLHESRNAEMDPYLPVYWTHDFNIGEGKPMSSLLCQVKTARGSTGKRRTELHVFDELVLDTADTNDAVAELEERYEIENKDEWIIAGDAAGKAADTRSKTSDYGIIRDAGFGNQVVPMANPAIRSRHNNVNRLLRSAKGDVRIQVHPRCKTLLKGLETVTTKPGGQYIEKETYHQHVTTALGYLAHVVLPPEGRVAARTTASVLKR